MLVAKTAAGIWSGLKFAEIAATRVETEWCKRQWNADAAENADGKRMPLTVGPSIRQSSGNRCSQVPEPLTVAGAVWWDGFLGLWLCPCGWVSLAYRGRPTWTWDLESVSESGPGPLNGGAWWAENGLGQGLDRMGGLG